MKTSYDVIVVGGGPAGLMAAVAAGEAGATVLLVEKGKKLGRKLIISGGGRCNVTNRKPFDELIRHIPGNGRFLYSTFTAFGSEQIVQFFERLGIRLKEEDNGRIFPVTDKAVTVAAGLIDYLRTLGVQFMLEAPVDRLLFQDDQITGLLLHTGQVLEATAVVVAVGGKSVPQTGSTGDGYAWAEAAGHTITRLYPTEVPLEASDTWIRDRTLQGISLRGIEQTLWDPAGKRVTTQAGDMVFTHFGLSGPATLRSSHYVSVLQGRLGRVPLTLTIDLFPNRKGEQLFQELLGLAKDDSKRAFKNVLRTMIPERMIPLLLDWVGIDQMTTAPHLAHDRLQALARFLKAFPVTITGTLSIEEAFVTGGGVSIKEVDPATMQSRKMNGLFFAGEVLDVHGHTGGYNITVAFATGHAAGHHAAVRSLGADRFA